jgi:hypothetical protein
MKQRHSSFLALNDLLFNILLGFVCLFIIAFLMINPISKTEDIPFKAEFLIVVEWDKESKSDVDVWVMGPDAVPVGFNNKNSGYITLERDDLGSTSDTFFIDGKQVVTKINREIVTIRNIVPGSYYINLHLYNKSLDSVGETVTVTVMDVNPYIEAYSITVELKNKNDVLALPAFTVNNDGDITNTFESNKIVIPRE